MAGLLGGAAVLILVLGDDGVDHPDEWDERVVDLVAFVEQERGLEFVHPVHVEFLTAEEYSELMRVDASEVTDDERADMEEWVALLRALGLHDGEFDPVEATNELYDEGTLAVYSFDTQRIHVRGTEVDTELEVTLVHELVHALQDQHFDLGRLATVETAGEATALRAVVEGDAMLVERRYIETLPLVDQGHLLGIDPEADGPAEPDADLLGDVPEILIALFAGPYLLGEPLVTAVEARSGWDGVDIILADPPTTEVELIDPDRLTDGFEAVEVDLPDGADLDLNDEGDLGALTLYLVLSARIDPLDAMAAVDRWAGDRYATYDDGGRRCVVLVVAGDGRDGHELLGRALGEWVERAPAGSDATVEVDATRVVVRSCDPGSTSSATPSETAVGMIDAASLLGLRAWIRAASISDGATDGEATCAAEHVIAGVPLEVLVDPDPSPGDLEQFQRTWDRAGRDCAAA